MDHILTFKMIVLTMLPTAGIFFSRDNFPKERKLEPFVAGRGALNYVCGQCNHVILKSLLRMQVPDSVYKCPKCGAYNQVKV